MAAVAAPPPSCPVVSISLVTEDRPLFLEHALELIEAQDFPTERLEVLLVDSSQPPVERLVRSRWPVDSRLGARLRYFHLPGPVTIGEKRNMAVKNSRGSIIVQWDDDDYYGPTRLREQIAPIRDGRARCTALSFGLWYFLDQGEFWLGPPSECGYGFAGGHPGTFAFDRSIWSEHDARLQYPNTNFADPDEFQEAAADLLQARTEEITRDKVDFVYVRHRKAAASCEGDLRLGLEECLLGIYFEVLGVRSFGTPAATPHFLPQRTLDLWARIRAAEALPTAVSTYQDTCAESRFDHGLACAFEALQKNLGHHSDEDLRLWVLGKQGKDSTRRRAELREAFLSDVLPALLARMVQVRYRIAARSLVHAASAVTRLNLGHASNSEHLAALLQALKLRLRELQPSEAKEAAFALVSQGHMTWEVVD